MKESPSWLVVPMISWRAPAWAAPAAAHETFASQSGSRFIASATAFPGASRASGSCARSFRSLTPAHGDADFEKVSQFVSAQTVVAHVRKASVGRVAAENTHPFQRGPWLFAHNGTLPDWERVRPPLESLIDPSLRGELHGETDSERCFLLFLSRLRGHCDPERADVGSAAAALAETVALVREIAERGDARASTTFLATDGRLLLACRRGRTLFLSSPAPDRSGACGYVAIAGEDPGEPPPGGKRAWRLLPEEALVAGDERLRLRVTSLLPE